MSAEQFHFINSEVILVYLNELGYININAKLLKEFLMDLKKLMKYYRQSNVYIEGKPIYSFLDEQSSLQNKIKNHPKQLSEEVQIPSCHKLVKNNLSNVNREITVHLRTNNKRKHKHCIHIEKSSESSCIKSGSSINTMNKNRLTDETKTTLSNEKSSVIGSNSDPSLVAKNQSTKKLAKSVNNFRKCDPVNLYHQYQQAWKKVKFPGEHNHDLLRQLVRERLRSKEHVKFRST